MKNTLFALLAATLPAASDVEPQAAMLRWPDVGPTHICFVYANDIWIVPRAGGVALPLASPPGQETLPKFSPDGKTIAFVGNYDGNRDLYTISASPTSPGGIPVRVTHHPAAEALADWTPDGKLLYITNGFAGLPRQSQLYSVAATGGMPTKMPVPYGGFGAVSPDGTWLAYTPHSTETRTWKRYRGGMATDVWLFNLKDKTSRRMTDWEGTDTLPMWVPAGADGKGGDSGTVYYLSDNGPEHRLNIWKYTLASQKREQVTTFKDDDVKWPSIGPGAGGRGEIVFQLGSELRLLDLATKKDSVVKVTIPGDRPAIRPHAVDASKHIDSASISPTGKRVVLEARGDIWSAPAKEGVVRNLTRTDGTFERTPAWSPDGKWIAYWSDACPPGEYELYIRPSDGRPADEKADKEKADKEKEAAEPKADEAKGDQPEKKKEDGPGSLAAQAEPRQVTNLGPGFRYGPAWSPDSKHICFSDQAGRLYLTTVEGGETKVIDTDPYSGQMGVSWSGDSNWMAYSRSDDDNRNGCIWLYDLKAGKKTRVTEPMFNSGSPTFDRKGEYLYFGSNRSMNAPIYGDLDTTWVYSGTEMLYLTPLRKDIKSPWAPKSDEEEIKKEGAEDKKDDKKDEKKDDKGAAKNGDGAAAAADDGLSGNWSGTATGPADQFPPEGISFTLHLTLRADGTVTGSSESPSGDGQVTSGKFNKETGELTLTLQVGDGTFTLTGTVKSGEASGAWTSGEIGGKWTCKRTSTGGGKGAQPAAEKGGKKDKAPKEVKIDLEDFEHRAIALPVPPGRFGTMGLSSDHKLIYVRFSARGGGGGGDAPGADGASIKIFDPTDDAKEEKTVTAAGGFDLSADGKKLLVFRAGTATVYDAAAGGGKSTSVPTAGMLVTVNPRNEWRQIFTDTWRLERDFFYEPTMHGVDWPKMREHYLKMIDDCVSREDVAYVQGELISELNIGHAYVTSPGEIETAPSVAVGMLGCDYELATTDQGKAYRITRIYEGGTWDIDARGPLSQPGVDVKTGDFLLAVNAVPVDTSQDPWAAFIGTADKPTTITVSENPFIDGKARDVLVKPGASEAGLRYRAYIESKRAYVQQHSEGKVGYIYVPSTGLDGQSDLYRQFQGQREKPALIIDERWNSGGQIPTRFIELLNRPVTNYWARRNGKDWTWPPDSHQGTQCMLINGLAGSGGDMFPWLFRFNKLGKLIGTRTWGGLVGISGNPGLIDGGSISVPTFGFYKTDGHWGVEGHGVDPDIELIDDPALMTDGGDPQLDKAISLMLEEVTAHPYTPPARPASPDRSGMGSKPEDR